jgi:hypothetical protein
MVYIAAIAEGPKMASDLNHLLKGLRCDGRQVNVALVLLVTARNLFEAQGFTVLDKPR